MQRNLCLPEHVVIVHARRRGIVGPLGVSLIAGLSAGCGPAEVTWTEVAAVVHEECSSCHRDAGPAPFSLLTESDAIARAAQIADAVRSDRMPPWLPVDEGVEFEGERRLTDYQRTVLLEWAENGTASGDPADHPSAPVWPDGWALGEPDLILTMNEEYPVPSEGSDHFRNFVLRVPLDEPRYVRAVELRPTNPRVVHHATMRVDPTVSSRMEDARDPLPGFDDMFSRTEARPPGGFFLGWTPGRVPRENPEGLAWTLEPGTDFIVQLHLRPTGMHEEVAAEVGLYFTDRRPTTTPVIVRLGGQTMDIPAGESDYVVEDEFRLPVAVQALGVYPHAHYLADEMEVWAELPDGARQSIISIPDWDFNWQDAYRYADPVDLPAGSLLKMRYSFDNSSANPQNPNSPPARVVYGPASADEMAELWLQVTTPRATDLLVLQREMALKDRQDQVEGWTHLANLDPDNAQAQFGLGTAAQGAGDLDEAGRRYRLALEASPDFAQADYNLGLIAEERGDLAGAERRYESAVRSLPEYPQAWNNLGRIRAARGQEADALSAFETAVQLDPENPEALTNLGGTLRMVGDLVRSLELLTRAVQMAPTLSVAHLSLSQTLAEVGQIEGALQELNAGLRNDRGNVGAALAVAWIMATNPDPTRRAPQAAVGLADQIRASAGPLVEVLDAQAVAYAAAGRMDAAVQIGTQAVTAARAQASPDLDAIEDRLEGYLQGRPFERIR